MHRFGGVHERILRDRKKMPLAIQRGPSSPGGGALNDAYEKGILPAVKDDCGFDPIRIDRVQHNDEITDRILAGIRMAQFMVADFTRQRQGVYFEAGFAAGLGRTVIWTCRSSDFNKLHFDTRQRNHIKWNTPADLRRQLTERIRATVTLPTRFGGRP